MESNTFAKHTNVDTYGPLICYDILDVGKQLQPIGMLVVLDSILNRITQNRAKGRNTAFCRAIQQGRCLPTRIYHYAKPIIHGQD